MTVPKLSISFRCMGQYPEAHDENGYTSLIKTASQGKLAIVEISIKYKPNISPKDITKGHYQSSYYFVESIMQ